MDSTIVKAFVLTQQRHRSDFVDVQPYFGVCYPYVLTITTLWANSADKRLMGFFFFFFFFFFFMVFLENRL